MENYKEDTHSEVKENLKRNTVLNLMDGAISAFGMGMVPLGTLLVYYVSNFTDSKLVLGLMTTVYNLMCFTPQVLVAKRLQALKYYKSFSVTLGVAVRAAWLFLGIITFWLAGSHPSLYLVLFYIILSIIGLLSGLNSNVWLVYTARIIPSEKLSTFLSLRSSICGILEITGASVTGIVLSWMDYPNNYGLLFVLASGVLFISLIAYSRIIEPVNVQKKPVQMDNQHFFKRLKDILKSDGNFRIYLSSTALVAGLGKMSLAFQVVYAKEELSVTTGDVALMSTILFITQTIGYALWGVVVKKKGLKFAGTASGIMFIPAILLTLWMPNRLILYVAVTLMSLAQSYRNSNENKLIINLAPNEELLPSYIGLRNTIMGPFFAFNTLIAGLILDISSFMVLTVISFILMVLGLYLFAFRLKVPELEGD